MCVFVSLSRCIFLFLLFFFFFQAEDGIRDVERSRGLGDVYKRQIISQCCPIYSDNTYRLLLRTVYCFNIKTFKSRFFDNLFKYKPFRFECKCNGLIL
eukprot:TRINITY_DN58229_c0_g2_i1.p1 TRINITY_DN58229_c0_g2~~TRINITY_DN58229_c0_g2_i1.p1  ORF type:complete len:108 (+),score=15.65 TRINITY_DN58229_c0_g2_i1:33-326(+)